MFGYIRPFEDELKMKDFRLYRALYCGLCKSCAKRISRFSRFFLSYDYTFFAAVRMIFEKTPIETKTARCGFHLFSKKEIIADNNALSLASAIFSILTYYKLVDNIKDEGFFASLGSRLALPIASRMRKKAIKAGFSDAEMVICDCMEKINELEKSRTALPFELSEAFGEMLGYLMKLGLDEMDKQDAYTVGFEVGRFIYNADALDDLVKDEKKGSFNPYLNEYGDSKTAVNKARELKNMLLHGTDTAADILSERKKTADKALFGMYELSQNILYLGCPAVIEGILSKKE